MIFKTGYNNAQKELKDLIYSSVEQRLVADVPLGSFLSGGIDSSIISGVANEIRPGTKTFSIGYADSPHFDDQSQRYADGEFKDVAYYREDVEKRAKKTYHPGQEN